MSNKTKKSDSVKFELRTVADLEDGGYKEHYKNNTILDANLSNVASDILKCPKCDSADLYTSISKKYLECEKCDCVVKKSDVKKEKK